MQLFDKAARMPRLLNEVCEGLVGEDKTKCVAMYKIPTIKEIKLQAVVCWSGILVLLLLVAKIEAL